MSDHYKIAKQWKPVIYQGWKRNFDFLSPINFGEFIVPETTKDVHVYYHVKEDDNYFYLLYCFYHYKDWSELPPPLTSLDEHRHDFEGAMFVVDKRGAEEDDRIYPMIKICRAHYDLLFYKTMSYTIEKSVAIEPCGHAVREDVEDVFGDGDKLDMHAYRNYTLVPMDLSKKFWQNTRKHFATHGVTLPDKWNDRRIRRHYGAETDGLIYNDPAELIRLAKKMRIIND